jgi:glycosyltransferase involved in cell wall biosynthesis
MRSASGSQDPRVLFISYLFPPADTVGTRRVIKFIKYLSDFGYESRVLTTASRGSLPNDRACGVYRTDGLLGGLKRAVRAIALRKEPSAEDAAVGVLRPDSGLVRWQGRWLIPDPEVIWYLAAVRCGKRILDREHVSVLVSTSPPETNHLVALRLKQQTGLPWVADFRDGWMFEPLREARTSSAARHRLESALEQKVVAYADHLTTVNQPIADYFRTRRGCSRRRVTVITNGYDPDDFTDLLPRPATTKLRITHTGSLSFSQGSRSATGLLKALVLLWEQFPVIAKDIEVQLIGRLATDEIAAIQQSGLVENRTVVISGNQPYREALQSQIDSDVLLLIGTSEPSGVSTTKLYEYLATGRPILALTGESPAAQIVRNLEAGIVVAPEDVQGIVAALRMLHSEWLHGKLFERSYEAPREYDRRELTRQLASVFDDLLGQRGRSPE